MSKRWTRNTMAAALVAITAAPVHGQAALGAACAPNAKPANLNFTLKDLNGNDVTLSAYKGKVILLDFWATWCGPCKVEIPGFIELYTRYRSQGLQVLGFDVDDSIPILKQYVQQMKMNYPVLIGPVRRLDMTPHKVAQAIYRDSNLIGSRYLRTKPLHKCSL